ncbi:hypothetical protein GU333_11740 (plasmid) [Lactococcus raffinolactis]|jgi:hypothetical protein|uniref:Circular bacteriocin, circularin A/uberolysin family n=1 Tax=Pseudolactococcus chungangensis CAU 28 = DSM 22330 TaxID=1122154 RepID=A0A1K2HJ82_9LACT|nr:MULTISPECIES: hypothetical protein [Lactococcus]MBW9298882.1 hypothetical protein [Lactococcus raffinolactis]PCR99709.1 hypothetical protein RR45_GL001459 [Lactococcus chungangensis CAU 28 = DSM 22330]PCS09759.1 hypothetical protein RU88_GL001240 [Lactococcus raffinolactis]QIW57244.1 hypothetical protein GU335_11375 [Lactococcus raffinolactis]QIW61842.1 hypothetical protein GU333_11740 [Lactococcus raffinolactis]
MFDLVATGMGAGTAASVVDAIFGGLTIASALSLYAGLAGGAAWFLENGLKTLIKWAGKRTIISW